jgi:hypothetical protein
MARKVAVLAILGLAGCASLVAQQQHFSGSLRTGESYTHDLGRGLVLVVTTSSIQVQTAPTHQEADDFSGCVTPPFHGPNPTGLEAWQFVTEQNELLPKAELDVLRRREFQFVLTAADNDAACKNLDVAQHNPPTKMKDGTLVYGTPGYKPPPLGTGVVTLSEIELTHVGAGQRPDVQSLVFTADITLPLAKAEVK